MGVLNFIVLNFIGVLNFILEVSFCAMGGREDEFISEESLASWKQLSCKPFEMKWFNDGHFYIVTQLIAVSDYIVKSISCR